MSKVYVFDHPLIQHKTALLRSVETGTKEFRTLATEITTLMTFEATRNLELKDVVVQTPVAEAKVKMLKGEDIAIVPILRAGFGMVDGMLSFVPNARVGHVGLYRDPAMSKKGDIVFRTSLIYVFVFLFAVAIAAKALTVITSIK